MDTEKNTRKINKQAYLSHYSGKEGKAEGENQVSSWGLKCNKCP